MSQIKILDRGNDQVWTIETGERWKEICYLIMHGCSDELVLIDPGDDPDFISNAILETGNKFRFLLLTHAHHDHIGAVESICTRFGVTCHLHKGDLRLLHHAPMYALSFAGKKIERVTSFQTFEDTPSFKLGDDSIHVIHTPGHTPGSVCYSIGSSIFTGDTLLNEHIGRTDLPGGDRGKIQQSIEFLLNLPGDDQMMLFPGHGSSWTLGQARKWWQLNSALLPEYKETTA